MGVNQSTQLFVDVMANTNSQQLFNYSSLQHQGYSGILQFPAYIGSQPIIYYTHPVKDCLYQLTLSNLNQITIRKMTQNSSIIWKVIKQNQSHNITQGSFIKIGKIKLKVKHINISPPKRQLSNHSNSRSLSAAHSISKDQICRICFDSHATISNPLVCLCKCSGSVKLIHYQCLKDWTLKNINKKQYQNYIYYSYIQTHCQICKSIIPNEFTHQGLNFSLLNFDTPSQPHIILELDEVTPKPKTSLFVINLTQGVQVLIGRNDEADVMMKDISVSRVHCSLTLTNNKVFLRDKKSKFGTLVSFVSQQFSIQNGVSFQCDSKVIHIYKQQNLTACCCSQNQIFKVSFSEDRK